MSKREKWVLVCEHRLINPDKPGIFSYLPLPFLNKFIESTTFVTHIRSLHTGWTPRASDLPLELDMKILSAGEAFLSREEAEASIQALPLHKWNLFYEVLIKAVQVPQ